MSARPRLGDYFINRQEAGLDGLSTLSVTMNDGLVNRDELDRRTETTLLPDQHLLVRQGDIAYNMMRMWQGACGLAESDGLVSPAYIVLAPKAGVDSRFAYHWFKSARMSYLFWAYSHGLTEDRLRLYFDDFAEIPVAPPPIDQQRRIVAVLDTWDRAIGQTERLIAAKRRRWQNLISVCKNRWKPVPLEKLGQWVGGGTPSKAVKAYWQDGDIPWVSPKDMAGWRIYATEDAITSRAVRESATQVLPPGSVLVVARSGILRTKVPVAVAMTSVCVNQDIKALILPAVRFGSIVAALIYAEGDRLRQSAVKTGTTVESIDIESLKSFQIAIPEGDREQDIAYAIAVGGLNEIDGLQQQLLGFQKQKRGLMQKLLTAEWQLDGRFDAVPSLSSVLAGAMA